MEALGPGSSMDYWGRGWLSISNVPPALTYCEHSLSTWSPTPSFQTHPTRQLWP